MLQRWKSADLAVYADKVNKWDVVSSLRERRRLDYYLFDVVYHRFVPLTIKVDYFYSYSQTQLVIDNTCYTV